MKLRYEPIVVTIYLVAFFNLASCRKFIEAGTSGTEIAGTEVFGSDETASSVMTGIYSRMMNGFPGFANGGITVFTGLSSDELVNFASGGSQNEFYTNSLTASNVLIKDMWSKAFELIYSCNAVLEGVYHSTGMSLPVKDRLNGEAKFLRAFCNFYLVNMFGDIPIVVTTDYQVNSSLQRMPVRKIYQFIESDLIDASNLLLAGDPSPLADRTRPGKFAADALLARVYLYDGEWEKAAKNAGEIIGNHAFYALETNISDVFLPKSREAIWQLVPVTPGINTPEGNSFILQAAPSSVALRNSLVTGFEESDLRKTNWIDSFENGEGKFYFPFKYKVKVSREVTEYYTVIRLAEIYLIRAEARAMQYKITTANEDLNMIRSRANLPGIDPKTRDECLKAIMQERKIELFCEWGHRWFDLKRSGDAGEVLATLKGGWQETDVLYPIPIIQIINDPATTQNEGY